MEQGLDAADVAAENTIDQGSPESGGLSQEQVNRIVAREKSRAAEAARREAESKYQQELEKLQQIRQSQAERNDNVSRDVDADAIYQQVQERFNAKMQEEQMRKQMEEVASNYLRRVEDGKKAYADFEEVTKEFDPTAFPQLTFLLSGIENAGDVLYDISKNPMKLAALDRIAEKNPRLAQNELQKLAKSIAENKQAQMDAQYQQAPDPLDRLSPTRISGDRKINTISDLRNQDWLRG
jgi:hypothetical protein